MDLIIFIVALSILVLVHEFGHFFAAKITGVGVEEFGLGLPPRIIGKRWKGTIWSLNWLLIGGFCKLHGEDPSVKTKDRKSSFQYKNPWQKGLIVLGGVLMNIVLAVVIFSVVYSRVGIPVETNRVTIVGVSKDSPAEEAGLKDGDVVLKVNDVSVTMGNQLTDEVGKYKGEEVNLEIERKNDVGAQGIAPVQMKITVAVRENPPQGEGSMGVAISNTEMQKLKWYEFYKGIGAGFKEAYFWGKIIFGGVMSMVSNLVHGQIPKDVSGPVGIFQATSSIKQSQGLLAVIHFFGIVSVNLAVVNVLPFPALDGGRIIFVIYEMLFRKRANEKFEAVVNNVGMAILLTLLVTITASDLLRIIKK